ncbi:unnamed protein product [Calicophoron daubneyi]|uniref:MARVEL domain-containing protein n=1 Tax=Calicophoron daubneyi TaxID=300641 RepID=A0AAV2TCI8_CALDB
MPSFSYRQLFNLITFSLAAALLATSIFVDDRVTSEHKSDKEKISVAAGVVATVCFAVVLILDTTLICGCSHRHRTFKITEGILCILGFACAVVSAATFFGKERPGIGCWILSGAIVAGEAAVFSFLLDLRHEY